MKSNNVLTRYINCYS